MRAVELQITHSLQGMEEYYPAKGDDHQPIVQEGGMILASSHTMRQPHISEV